MIRRFVRNTSWVLGGNVLSKLISFVTLGFLARVLSPDHLGYYNGVQNAGNYINMMCSMGTSIVIQRIGARLKELGPEKVSEIFSNAFSLYLFLNALAGLAIILLPNHFFEILLDSQGNADYMIFIFLLVLLNALGQIPLYLILGLGDFRKYTLRNLASTIVVLLVSAFFILLMNDNLLAAFYGLIAAYFINGILTGIVLYGVIKKYAIKIKLKFQLKGFKVVIMDGFIYYIGNTFLGAVAGLVTISLFFNHLSPFDYGFTRIASAFALMLSIIPASIQPVTISLMAVDHEKNQYVKSLQIRVIPFISTLAFVIVVFNMELIVGLLFGAEYIDAKDIIFAMMLIQIPNIYLGLITNFQVGAGHLNFVGVVAIISCLAMIVCSFLLVPLIGIKGYFAAIYISTFFALIIIGFREFYHKRILSNTDVKSAFLILTLFILSYFMMYWIPEIWKIPLTIITLVISIGLFWNFCMDSLEKDLLLVELRKRRISLK